MADGGEGTLEAAVAAGYEERLNAVVGPILAPIGAAWAIRKDASGGATAVIETAQASGLAHMEPTPANSLRAHSYGCGQLIAAALDAGATEIVLGVGGSAMSDGGSGALPRAGAQAAGRRRQRGAAGRRIAGRRGLRGCQRAGSRGCPPSSSGSPSTCRIRCTAPTARRTCSARRRAPMTDAIEKLDAGLRNWASVLREATGRDVNVPGAGAAGGFPASFLAFTHATLEGGFELVAGLTGLAEKLEDADLVITGEGSMDSQSLTGKAPIALADAARERGIPVIVVAGRILVTPGGPGRARRGGRGAAAGRRRQPGGRRRQRRQVPCLGHQPGPGRGLVFLLLGLPVQVHGNVGQQDGQHSEEHAAGNEAHRAPGGNVEHQRGRSHTQGSHPAEGDLGDVIRAGHEGCLKPASRNSRRWTLTGRRMNAVVSAARPTFTR